MTPTILAILALFMAQSSPTSPLVEPEPAPSAASGAGSAANTDPASGAAGAAVTAQDADNRRVCKNQSQTMTRFRKKTCRTKREWDRVAEENQRAFAEQQSRPAIGGAGDN